MTKICVLTHTFPRFKNDTTAAFMHPLVLGLKKAGNKVIVLTPYHPQIKPKDFPYKIITYKYIWPDCLHLLGYSRSLKAGFKLTPIVYLLSPFLYFFGTLALLRLCRKEKIDVICSHWILPNGFIAFLTSRFLKIPYSITLPGSDVFLAKKNLLFKKMALIAANQAGVVLADSPQFLADLKSLDTRIKKSEIITYPVEIEKMKPKREGQKKLRSVLKIKQQDLIILVVARLVAKKGIDFLMKAASALMKKNQKVKLMIIGDGDLWEELKSLSRQLRINKQTIFLTRAPREKMVSYYNLADIFVASSIRDKEGNMDDSPVSLFEAMACGRPVVATNFPGIAKVVKDGVNGFLVEEKNVKSIREALIRLIKSKILRKKMGQASRRIAEMKLSAEQIGTRYTRILESLFEPVQLYWEERAKMWQSKKESVLFQNLPNLNLYLHQLQLRELFRLLPSQKCLCLDLGCGYGRIAQAVISRYPQYYVHGVDFVKTYVKLFNQKLKKRGKAVLTNISHLPFKNDTFDFVWSMTTLSFLEKNSDRQQAVQEIFRVLKPKGKVIIFEPNKLGTQIASPWLLFPVFSKISHPFSWQEINRLVEKSGGRIIQQKGYLFLTLSLPMIIILEKTLPFLTNYLFAIIKKLDNQFPFSHLSYWILYLGEKE